VHSYGTNLVEENLNREPWKSIGVGLNWPKQVASLYVYDFNV
jgi:hypothetical protein